MSRIHATINTNRGYGICSLAQDHNRIYNSMMYITGNDHEIASEAVSWCGTASVGEVYEFRDGTIIIVEY